MPPEPPVSAPSGVPPAAPPDVYRSTAARVIGWLWVVFAAANLLDLAIQGHNHFSAVVAAVLILITGITFVTAFRPRVVADDEGLLIRNPLRDHRVPWACVESLELGDSVEVRCHWDAGGGPQRKKLYAWAVHSPRRSRLKAEIRANRKVRTGGTPAGYARLPPEAQAAMNKTAAELIVNSLRSRADQARAAAQGADGGRPDSRWDWLAIAAVVIPAVLVVIVALV